MYSLLRWTAGGLDESDSDSLEDPSEGRPLLSDQSDSSSTSRRIGNIRSTGRPRGEEEAEGTSMCFEMSLPAISKDLRKKNVDLMSPASIRTYANNDQQALHSSHRDVHREIREDVEGSNKQSTAQVMEAYFVTPVICSWSLAGTWVGK